MRCELFTSLSEMLVKGFVFGALRTTNRLWTGITRVGVSMKRKEKKRKKNKESFFVATVESFLMKGDESGTL